MPISPALAAAAVLAVLLTGASKGGLGGAFGGVAVPILSFFLPPPQAAAIMLPLLSLMDVASVRAYWRQWNGGLLKTLVPGGLAGTVLGTLTFGALPAGRIRVLVGAIAIGFAIVNLARTRATAPAPGPAAVPPSRAVGAAFATVSGYTSFIAHAGVPPLLAYLLPLRLPKAEFVATMNVFFLAVNAAKLLAYGSLGQFSVANLRASVLLAPLIPVGVWLGRRLQERLDAVRFYRLAQLGMLGTGLLLLRAGLTE